MLKKNSALSVLMLFLTAIIWGLAFVAQSEGMKTLGTYTFYTARSFLAIVFISVTYAIKKGREKRLCVETPAYSRKDTIIGGLLCGVSMFLGSIFQQNGLIYTSVGKSGFITAIYILIVPILGIFLKKKVAPIMWACVALALGGMYLLCISDSQGINKGDIYTLLCSFFYAIQIISIDTYSKKIDPVKLSLLQFIVSFAISAVMMIAFEEPNWSQITNAAVPILYAGILSSGVAFTLQIVAQKHVQPTLASLIMSLESVFAAIFGWIILNQSLSMREIFGCVLVFAAIIISEIPWKNFYIRKKFKTGVDNVRTNDI